MSSLVSRLVAIAFFTAIVASGCTSPERMDDAEAESHVRAIGAELAKAETLAFTLQTEELPANTSGLLSAEGRGNRTPAFEGVVKLVSGGASISADIIAVDGVVWAKTSFSPDFAQIDPESLTAPDPAALVGTDNGGFVLVFAAAQDLRDEGQSRSGEQVLTQITGSLPGSVMATLLPSADADQEFTVSFLITDDDALDHVTMTGPFYQGSSTTYRLTIEALAESVDIVAPTN